MSPARYTSYVLHEDMLPFSLSPPCSTKAKSVSLNCRHPEQHAVSLWPMYSRNKPGRAAVKVNFSPAKLCRNIHTTSTPFDYAVGNWRPGPIFSSRAKHVPGTWYRFLSMEKRRTERHTSYILLSVPVASAEFIVGTYKQELQQVHCARGPPGGRQVH